MNVLGFCILPFFAFLHFVENGGAANGLQVDLWIVPNKVKDALGQNVEEDDSEEDEESDEDEEDDEDDEEKIGEDLANALNAFGAKLEIGTIDWLKESDCTRTLQQTFTKLLAKNAKRSVKICIVIDRRKQKDNLLVYLLPLKYSAIPRNYCNETLIYSSAHHMMYDDDNSVLKRDQRKFNRAKQGGDAKEEEQVNGRHFFVIFAFFGFLGFLGLSMTV